MAKKIPDAIMDVALAAIADAGDTLHACSGEPADYAGIAALTLGSVALTEGSGNGDYTIGNGDVSGRKLALAAQTIASATDDGNVTHLVIADAIGSVLLAVTTCASQAVLIGQQIDVDAYDPWVIMDPT